MAKYPCKLPSLQFFEVAACMFFFGFQGPFFCSSVGVVVEVHFVAEISYHWLVF